MIDRYIVKQEDKNYRIQDKNGEMGYKLIFNNRHDAVKHCNYLNRIEHDMDMFREQNIRYYNTLTKVKMLAEQIKIECGEIHILELAIRIKNIIKEVIK